MELLYDLLREACSCFLLFFLVVRIISLIVSTSDDDSSSFSGFVKDDFNRKNQLKIDGYKLVDDDDHDDEKHNKSIRFYDQNLEFVEDVDDQDVSKLVGEFVDHVGFQDNGKNCDVVDEIGGEFEKRIVGFEDNDKNCDVADEIDGNHEKRIVGFQDNGKNCDEIVGEFVDHEKRLVGFQDSGKNFAVADEIGGNYEKRIVGFQDNGKNINEIVGEFVDHGKKIVGFQDNGKNSDEIGGEFVDHGKKSVDFQDNGKNFGADEIGGRGEVDGNCEESDASSILILGEGSSNVCRGEASGRELDDEGVLSDEQEWEGIETSELEKSFARAMNWVECKVNQDLLVSKLGNDVMMQFYGLHKIAMEGTCHENQPLVIKRAARAKWNAWQKLGSMTREDAMEQYISLLSDSVPEWMEEDSTITVMKGKSSSSTTGLDSSPPEAN